MTETIFRKNVFDVYCISLPHVPSANMRGAGFKNYSAASQQGVIELFLLDFWEAVMTSIFIYCPWIKPKMSAWFDTTENISHKLFEMA